MKRNLLLLFFISFFVLGAKATPMHIDPSIGKACTAITDGFITTWSTDADNQSIIIPINPQYAEDYNYTVNWGDGASSINQTGNASHTYGSQGIHTVTITGDFPAIQFSNTISVTGNNQRLLTVVQWGNGIWKGMDAAFRYCQHLTTVPNVNGPIFAAGSTLYSMFYDCNTLNCDLNLWDLTNVREISQMFHGATAFNGDISDWNVSNVTNMENLFEKAISFNGDIADWDVSNVELMDHTFENARAFNGNIGNWNVGKVKDMNNMFSLAFAFNRDISAWNVSNVTNMFFMFSNAQSFNQSLNSWDVSNVTDMSYLFQGATAFNGDIRSWNVSKVINMAGMFVAAGAFNQDVSAWDVRAVKYMSNMFGNLSFFNQDISGWQTNSLTQMDGMFYQATAFNQNISGWNVSKVTNMSNAFYQATAFNQNLGAWQVGLVTNMQNMLDGTALSATNYEATLASWAVQTVQPSVILGAAGLKFCSSVAHQLLTGNHSWQILSDRQACLVPAVPDGAGIVYVDSAVVVPGDGSSWTNALKYLSNATESAKTNTVIKEVHIAKGTYYPTGDKNLLYSDSAFALTRTGLKLLGGYSNGGGQYNTDLYATILSGDIGVTADTTDNSANVMIISNIARGADSLILDGCTITGGKRNIDFNNASSLLNYNYAGGISIINAFANTVVSNCKLIENYGLLCSAMSVFGSPNTYSDPSLVATPQILNCLFKNNAVITLPDNLPLPLGSTFINSAASPYISHCDFIENKGLLGGAVANSGLATPFFNSCRFLRNTAAGMSVIFNNQNASAVLVNCVILDNVNTGYYNAMIGDETSKLYSNAMIGNTQFSSCRIINTTLANNKSLASPPTDRPLIFNISEASTYITNSIIWGNTTNTILDSLTSVPSSVSYSLIQGLAAGPSNHILDGTANVPVFSDTTSGDFGLITSSPAIDAGLNDSLLNALLPYIPGVSDGGLDLAGNTRIKDGVIDMGAYEFLSSSPLPVHLQYFSADLQNGVARLSWESGVEDILDYYGIEKSIDGKSFQKLASVKPTGSNSHYGYNAPQLEPTAYYRLKLADLEGKLAYSSTKKLAQNPASQSLLLYPNPAKNYINIRTGVANVVLIYNATGGFIKSEKLKAGVNKIDISQLSAGVYFAMIDGQNLQFVKQ